MFNPFIHMAITIYKILSPSNKIYIGQTRRFKSRMSSYRNLSCESQHALHNSLVKYGFDAHKISILEEYSDTTPQAMVNSREIFFIELFKKNLPLLMLNIALGGHGGLVNEETREKLRIRQTGKKYSQESRQKMSQKKLGKPSPRKGVALPEEVRMKISKNKMGCIWTDSHKRLRKIIDSKIGIIYRTIGDAAKEFKIKRTTLNAMLVGQNKNKTNLHFL